MTLTDYTRWNPLLPFSVENAAPGELQVFAAVPEAQQNNPILKISNTVNTVELWSKLPPVFRQQGNFRSKVESEVSRYYSFTINAAHRPVYCDKEC